ncbi:carboxylesterase/lipase family protein [Streptomyces sp. NPDC021012]|uniref:carboxylesterase/lipase family protein n=1 Tax=Streptomyces sp. NPDC021012 TaxID=3365107 RepID=UPI003797653B
MSSEVWQIDLGYGPVSGQVKNGIGTFLGVPYAEAPTGNLRYGAPAAYFGEGGGIEANAFGPAPSRATDGIFDTLLSGDPALVGDGNVLTVNVWAPREQTGPRPVMVWFHGGAFMRGSSAGTLYDGSAFAREGVVLVTFNYRLGMEGFGYLNNGTNNRGLHDQIAALGWVQDNIAEFGGDKDNVTVFGQSAGAMSILALLSSEYVAEDNLFHKAIVQSGTASIGQRPEDARRLSMEVALRVSTYAPEAHLLAPKDPGDVVKAQQLAHNGVVETADRSAYGDSTIDSCGMSFQPVIDGGLLPKAPIESLREGVGSKIPLLIGTTTEEHRFFVAPYPDIANAQADKLKERLSVYGAPASAYDVYSANDTAPYTRSTPAEVFAAVMTDRLFRIPSYHVAETRQREGAAPAYVYEIGWRSPATAGTSLPIGAGHIVDLPFLWDSLDAPGADKLLGATPPAELAKAIRSHWITFARTGKPGADWPAYDTVTRPVMTFAKDNTTANEVVSDPRSKERQLWDGVDFLTPEVEED